MASLIYPRRNENNAKGQQRIPERQRSDDDLNTTQRTKVTTIHIYHRGPQSEERESSNEIVEVDNEPEEDNAEDEFEEQTSEFLAGLHLHRSENCAHHSQSFLPSQPTPVAPHFHQPDPIDSFLDSLLNCFFPRPQVMMMRREPSDLLHHLTTDGLPPTWQREDSFSGQDYETLWTVAEEMDRDRNKGLQDGEIECLPTSNYFKPTSLDDDNLLTCKICLSEFEDKEEVRRLPCLHQYHTACIDEWLRMKAQCPTCRCDVREATRT
ncbi:hypothetical protein CAPTEDRAFT_219920, partial [Capitella teleta]